MMISEIDTKKELTEIEFQEILAVFQESMQTPIDRLDFAQLFQELLKKITPAKEVHLLLVSEPDNSLETITLETNMTINISSSASLLAECYQTKEALFCNDVIRNTDYNQETDNFLDYPLKNLLLAPLLNEEEAILGIIWAGIPQNGLKQYTQCDIVRMKQFSILDEKTLQKEIEEPHKSDSPSLVRKIRSWLFS